MYRVELTERAIRNLDHVFNSIQATHSKQAQAWFNGLEKAILGLEQFPERHAKTPEDSAFRHLLYGRKPNVYRVIYVIDATNATVTVLHIRHRAQDALPPQPAP